METRLGKLLLEVRFVFKFFVIVFFGQNGEFYAQHWSTKESFTRKL